MHVRTLKSVTQKMDIGNVDFKFNWMGESTIYIYMDCIDVRQSIWGDLSSSKEGSNVIPLG